MKANADRGGYGNCAAERNGHGVCGQADGARGRAEARLRKVHGGVGPGVGAVLLMGTTVAWAGIAHFEDLSLTVAESYYNGSDFAGGFTSGGAWFNNDFVDFGGGFTAWYGWSYSNVTDNTTPGFGNQYSAIAGGGAGGSAMYGVAYAFFPGDAIIELPGGFNPVSVELTNTTWAYYAMLDGDAFSKKFGGPGGTDPDFFRLHITGLDAHGVELDTVTFYLADYRFADDGLDYIVHDWTVVDLTSLAGARSLSFGLESSDVGMFGINTPTYFALDNLVMVPEPGGGLLMALAGWAVVRRRETRAGEARHA